MNNGSRYKVGVGVSSEMLIKTSKELALCQRQHQSHSRMGSILSVHYRHSCLNSGGEVGEERGSKLIISQLTMYIIDILPFSCYSIFAIFSQLEVQTWLPCVCL